MLFTCANLQSEPCLQPVGVPKKRQAFCAGCWRDCVVVEVPRLEAGKLPLTLACPPTGLVVGFAVGLFYMGHKTVNGNIQENRRQMLLTLC